MSSFLATMNRCELSAVTTATQARLDLPGYCQNRFRGNMGGPTFRAPLSFQQAPKAILAASR